MTPGKVAVDSLRTVVSRASEYQQRALSAEHDLDEAKTQIATLKRQLEVLTTDAEVVLYLTRVNYDLDKKCTAAVAMANFAFEVMKHYSSPEISHHWWHERARKFMATWEASRDMFIQVPLVDKDGKGVGGFVTEEVKP